VTGAPVPWASVPERQRLADATRADATTLAEVAAGIETLAARLAQPTFHRTIDIAPDSYRREMSLVNGRSHPFAPQLRMRELADGYEAVVTLGPSYEGGPGLVHGGAVSLLFDHVMAWATTRVGGPAPSMTGTMSLAYRRPTPLGVPLTIRAQVDRVSGRKLQVSALMTVDGEVTVEGTGLFIKLTEEHVRTVYRVSG
jgi:acyl-coenzyme A thioesterase PaaI-like protein